MGAWWGARDVELDVVGLNLDEGRAVFGECKFWMKPVGANVLGHLEEQAAKALRDASFGPYRNAPVFAVFSVSGFTDELQSIAAERSDVLLIGGE